MDINKNDTAVVFIDPQNEVLSEKGRAWGAVGDSVKENKTVENMERIFKAAKENGFEVFISPHYFFPTDSGWKFNGPLETDEFENKMFARSGRLSLDGFSGSGADWLERFKPYIEDGKTVVVSPHRVFGPQTNDLVLQLRKRRHQQGHPRRDVGEHVCRISPARFARAGFRSRRSKRRDGCPATSRVGLRLHGGAHQLRVSRTRGADDGRRRESYEIGATNNNLNVGYGHCRHIQRY